jgi:hypothetical protein
MLQLGATGEEEEKNNRKLQTDSNFCENRTPDMKIYMRLCAHVERNLHVTI